jgi:CTP synthase
MGSYERYLNLDLSASNYMTTGSVYLSVITKERNLEYGGRCVHVVPDIPLEVISRVELAGQKANADVVIVEIGGTIGDYQNVLFLEAVRILKFKQPKDVLLTLVSYVPGLGTGGNELKTKPTQHAVQNLNAVGLHPDIVLARATVPLDEKRKEKLEFMCSLEKGSVISAPDVSNIYTVPLNFEKEQLGDFISRKLGLAIKKSNLALWKNFVRRGGDTAAARVKIAVVGKYFGTGSFVLHDAYISVIEALKHAGAEFRVRPVLEWISSSDIEERGAASVLRGYDGVVVPGGFGSRGTEGMIKAITYARTKGLPYLGLCYGMQMATIEFARNVAGLKQANTTEVDKKTSQPVIHIMPDQEKKLLNRDYGASMRLGAWDCLITRGTKTEAAYAKAGWLRKTGKAIISERHRHRYEFNNEFRASLVEAGLVIAGSSPDGQLVEVIELPNHPFFVATQFHPEFLSRPNNPHPLFAAFIKACKLSSK